MTLKEISDLVRETFQTFGEEGDYISTKLGEILLISILLGTSLGLLGVISLKTLLDAMNIMTIVMAITFVLLVWAYSGVSATKDERVRTRKLIDIALGGIIWFSLVVLVTVSVLKSENVIMKIIGVVLVILVVFLPFVSTGISQRTDKLE